MPINKEQRRFLRAVAGTGADAVAPSAALPAGASLAAGVVGGGEILVGAILDLTGKMPPLQAASPESA